MIERYRRPDLGHLQVDLRLEDPGTFTKPVERHMTWQLAPGGGDPRGHLHREQQVSRVRRHQIDGGAMRDAFLTIIFTASAIAWVGSPAAAHHSFAAEFDITKPVTLTGKVTKIEWTNPHAFLFIDVPTSRRVP
jgi:hypothetical protein